MAQFKQIDNGSKGIDHSELWLYKHPAARESLLEALEDIRAGAFAKNPPDMDTEEPWMEELED